MWWFFITLGAVLPRKKKPTPAQPVLGRFEVLEGRRAPAVMADGIPSSEYEARVAMFPAVGEIAWDSPTGGGTELVRSSVMGKRS